MKKKKRSKPKKLMVSIITKAVDNFSGITHYGCCRCICS